MNQQNLFLCCNLKSLVLISSQSHLVYNFLLNSRAFLPNRPALPLKKNSRQNRNSNYNPNHQASTAGQSQTVKHIWEPERTYRLSINICSVLSIKSLKHTEKEKEYIPINPQVFLTRLTKIPMLPACSI